MKILNSQCYHPPKPTTSYKIGEITLKITTNQKGFSSWSFNEFKERFKITADCYAALPKFRIPPAQTNESDIQENIDSARNEIVMLRQICPHVFQGTEFARSVAVYEVLKEVTALYEGLLLIPQKSLSARLGNGVVDYVIECDGVFIMVTEAKREDMDQGVAQCAIELDSAECLNRKRKRENNDPVPDQLYGVVTTGTTWVFLRFRWKFTT